MISNDFDGTLLERLTYTAQTTISREMTDYLAIEPEVSIMPMIADDLCVEVRAHIYGRTASQDEVRHPMDWWEALKDRFFPQWAKRRWPVAYMVYTMTARELYPKVKLPNQSPVIVVHTSTAPIPEYHTDPPPVHTIVVKAEPSANPPELSRLVQARERVVDSLVEKLIPRPDDREAFYRAYYTAQ